MTIVTGARTCGGPTGGVRDHVPPHSGGDIRGHQVCVLADALREESGSMSCGHQRGPIGCGPRGALQPSRPPMVSPQTHPPLILWKPFTCNTNAPSPPLLSSAVSLWEGDAEASLLPFLKFFSHRRSSTGDAFLSAWSHDAFVSKQNINKNKKADDARLHVMAITNHGHRPR